MRVLRPHGGVAIFDLARDDVARTGPPPGEGEWTHLYGDPGNTACSNDQRVGGDLHIQWFGKPGPRTMIDRHHRTVAPLYKQGRMFVPGEDRVTAVDAYNGTILWDLAIPDSRRIAAFRDSSYLALANDALYVAAGVRCLVLNPRTGGTQRIVSLPDSDGTTKHEWGFLATVDDVVVGSAVKHGSIRRVQSTLLTQTETHWDFVPSVGSDYLFAHDRHTGKPRWTYRARTGLIVNPTLTIGAGRVYFLESNNPATLAATTGRAEARRPTWERRDAHSPRPRDGQSRLGEIVEGLCRSAAQCLRTLRPGSARRRRHAQQRHGQKKDVVLYDIHAYDAATGKLTWKQTQKQADLINGEHGEQERHPALVGDKLFCEPKAYELHTGQSVAWNWPWTQKARRGCGTLSASASSFFFRNDHVSSFDLDEGKVRPLTTETRPAAGSTSSPSAAWSCAPRRVPAARVTSRCRRRWR